MHDQGNGAAWWSGWGEGNGEVRWILVGGGCSERPNTLSTSPVVIKGMGQKGGPVGGQGNEATGMHEQGNSAAGVRGQGSSAVAKGTRKQQQSVGTQLISPLPAAGLTSGTSGLPQTWRPRPCAADGSARSTAALQQESNIATRSQHCTRGRSTRTSNQRSQHAPPVRELSRDRKRGEKKENAD